jgi:hypothetical protein
MAHEVVLIAVRRCTRHHIVNSRPACCTRHPLMASIRLSAHPLAFVSRYGSHLFTEFVDTGWSNSGRRRLPRLSFSHRPYGWHRHQGIGLVNWQVNFTADKEVLSVSWAMVECGCCRSALLTDGTVPSSAPLGSTLLYLSGPSRVNPVTRTSRLENHRCSSVGRLFWMLATKSRRVHAARGTLATAGYNNLKASLSFYSNGITTAA